MDLEEKCDARQMVMNAGMSARPEFYSGRGALIDDLTEKKLEKIREQIEYQHGTKAAHSFAQMVADIPVLLKIRGRIPCSLLRPNFQSRKLAY